MATQRSIEIRVGIFVLVCLALGAGLIWQFGKLRPGTKNRYAIDVLFENVGGLISGANVSYAGVGIGKVNSIELVREGKPGAEVTLGIDPWVEIPRDAKFVINQAGLLGDRYVDVIPGTAKESLKAGDKVYGSPSVDLTEAIRGVIEVLRQTAGTIDRINTLVADLNTAVRRVDGAVARVDGILLSTQNLERVTGSIANIELATSNAVAFTQSLRGVVEENRSLLTNTFGRLSAAATGVNQTVQHVDEAVRKAEADVQVAVKDLAASAEKLKTVIDRLEQGQGTIGKLLVDPTLHDEILEWIRNLRQHGLLYRERTPPRRPDPTEPRRGTTPIPARPSKSATD